MVSYYLQFAITLLLGPIGAVYRLAHGENEVLQQLLLSFWGSNLFIFISFIMAVCVRRWREPYFLEIIFLDTLSLFELLLLNIIVLSILFSFLWHEDLGRYHSHMAWGFMLDMYYLLIAIPYRFQDQAFDDLTEACTQVLAPTLPDYFGVDFRWLTQQYGYHSWAPFTVPYIVGGITAVWLGAAPYIDRLAERVPILHWLPGVAAGAAVAAPALYLLILGFLCTYELGFSRKLMAEAAAAMDQPFLDDEWGFGQITALTAWIPVFWAFMVVLARVREKSKAAEVTSPRDELLAAQQNP